MIYSLQEENGFAVYRDLDENRTISIPKDHCMGLFEAGDPPAVKGKSVYLEALCQPEDGLPLRTLAEMKKAKTAAVIISDITRQVPTAKVAPQLVEELVAGGVPLSGITFFVALGVHRPATEEEMRLFLGEELYGKVAIENHEPYDEAALIDLGVTQRGTPVKVNKKAYLCDIKITIGKVELHEMAGFSGGRKSILPGVSSEETILVNHRPEMIFSPGTGAGKLEGNPIHEDMLETAKLFGVHFSINFVVNNSGEVAGVFGGSLEGSHQAAVAFLRRFVDVKLPQAPDIAVICPGQPLSCDLYQGVKALIAMQHVLRPDTVVVLYGAFPEGMNSVDFPKPLQLFEDLDEAKAYTIANYRIQMDHTLPIIDLLKREIRVIVCTEGVSATEIRQIRMSPVPKLDEALQQAYTLCGKAKPQVAFCPHPQKAVLTLAEPKE